jgi:hypothetical protein
MSKQAKKIPQPNYVRKMPSLWQIGAIPREAGLRMVSIDHNDWYGIFQGQCCDCDPTIRLKATVLGYQNEGEPRWLSIDPGGSRG